MSDPIRNQIVAVTGGTRGIGRAVVEALMDAGAQVAFCGTSSAGVDRALKELSGRGRVIGAVADVGKPEDVARFFQLIDEQLGALDVLVNNAGLGIFHSVADLTLEEWHKVIDTNLNGVFYCSREALSRFQVKRHGYIINISSLAGRNPFAGGAAYSASKFAVNGFSEAMMLDHRHDGVKVSYIMPGSVSSNFGASGAADWKIPTEDIAEIVFMLLRTSPRTLISRVEVRPSRPPR